jgi:hypothetical protein
MFKQIFIVVGSILFVFWLLGKPIDNKVISESPDVAEIERKSSIGQENICISSGPKIKTGGYEGKNAKQYLIDHGLIKDGDVSLVQNNAVDIGMTRCAMLASYGLYENQNITKTQYSTNIQHIYFGNHYIYTKNDVVTSIQN